MKKSLLGGAMIRAAFCGLCLLPCLPASAKGPPLDRQGDKKKAEKDLDEAEKAQKGEKAKAVDGGENPLPKILELMEKVEDRLYEANTGKYTRGEQKRIVEAMRFEAKSTQALDELIKRIENQPP